MGFKEVMYADGPTFIFMSIWVIFNLAVFLFNFYKYRGEKWDYLRAIVGDGLPWARGAANILNLNAALIVLPVSRNLVNWLRGCFECRRSIRRLFDNNIVFHIYCAWAICLGSCIHIGAHVFNVHRLTESVQYEKTAGQNWEDVLFTDVPGYTGLIITVSLILMVSTAVEGVRRSFFELFWFTHHLFIAFYGAMLFHGYDGFVMKQTNADEHPFGCTPRTSLLVEGPAAPGTCLACLDKTTGTCELEPPGVDPPGLNCCPNYGTSVVLEDGGPGSWMWLVGPLCIYFLERMYRFFMKQWRPLKIVRVVKHNDSTPVLEINMTKVPTKAGQYIFINCPAVSRFEWHPFTLTSCPQLDTINLHIRIVGDWTGAFAEACGLNCLTFKLKTRPPHDPKAVKRLLTRLLPHRRVTVIHALHDGRIQHPSDIEFSSKDVDILKRSSEIDADSVTTRDMLSTHLLPTVAIDGPFGTASEDVYRFKAAVLVGAGIGVTPFASLLQEFYFRLQNPHNYQGFKTKKVYFYWMCPGFSAWGWFASLLIEVEQKLAELGFGDFLEIRIHMTRGWTDDDARKIMLQDDEQTDNLFVRDEETGRGLRAKMNFGRPQWEKVFADWSAIHRGEDVGVFLCGPAVLAETLNENCHAFSDVTNPRGTKFFFHKENF